MLTCRDLTARASLIVDGELPRGERFGVGFHLLICPYCRRFLKQLRTLTAAIRMRSDQRAADTPATPDLQEKIVAALLAATTSDPPGSDNRPG